MTCQVIVELVLVTLTGPKLGEGELGHSDAIVMQIALPFTVMGTAEPEAAPVVALINCTT